MTTTTTTQINTVIDTRTLLAAVDAHIVQAIDKLRGHMERGELRAAEPNLHSLDWSGGTAADAIQRATAMLLLSLSIGEFANNTPRCRLEYISYDDGDGDIKASRTFLLGDDRDATISHALNVTIGGGTAQKVLSALLTDTTKPTVDQNVPGAHTALCLAAGAAHAKLMSRPWIF